ncbi:hypothetical protein TNCV_2609111 [Trichonephila clavipes]|nr:hypothetical protein TNCV_2609111 [Trichonephila clavipes]
MPDSSRLTYRPLQVTHTREKYITVNKMQDLNVSWTTRAWGPLVKGGNRCPKKALKLCTVRFLVVNTQKMSRLLSLYDPLLTETVL